MIDCKTCELEKLCEMPDFVRNDLKKCATYRQKNPQTQADKIRAMSDEELAEFINRKIACDCCSAKHCNSDERCEVDILQWLKSEVKE